MSENQEHENLILKKRLNTCGTAKGNLSRIPDDLIIDIIRAWERWPGTAKSFYTSIGIKKQQLAIIIKKGKKLFKDGKDKLGPFIPMEIKPSPRRDGNKTPMILNLDKKRTIRFYEVNRECIKLTQLVLNLTKSFKKNGVEIISAIDYFRPFYH